ncbi:MAG: P1 family peptidase, partial [bacterium]
MPRLRDVLPAIGILPAGSHNAITDVPGVRIGHATVTGGSLRTGVTAVLPGTDEPYRHKVTAAAAVLNGYGKSIGLMQIEELGTLETPILLTSTLNVPRVADAVLTYMMEGTPSIGVTDTVNPVVLEEGEELFDFATARYSISAEHGKCLLHLWSEERNT